MAPYYLRRFRPANLFWDGAILPPRIHFHWHTHLLVTRCTPSTSGTSTESESPQARSSTTSGWLWPCYRWRTSGHGRVADGRAMWPSVVDGRWPAPSTVVVGKLDEDMSRLGFSDLLNVVQRVDVVQQVDVVQRVDKLHLRVREHILLQRRCPMVRHHGAPHAATPEMHAHVALQ